MSTPSPTTRLLTTLSGLAGVFASAAAVVYFTGGVVLSLRLGLERLPSTAAVSHLPREFLISLGLNVVLPALAVGGLVAAGLRWRRQPPARTTVLAIVAGVAAYVIVGAAFVAKSPFPAKVCFTDGREASGVWIGETAARTYIGDPPASRPRRIVSIPLGRIERVLVGGSQAQLAQASCPVAPE